MTIVPVAEWCPDRPDLSDTTSVLSNAIPITEDAYGPVASLQPYGSSALNGQCLGTAAVQDVDLTATLFAGTANKLYLMNSSSPTWTDVSVVGDGFCQSNSILSHGDIHGVCAA
jgi:hypothetical protein